MDMIRAYFTFRTSGTQINSESKDLEHISFGTSSKIAWAWRKIE